MNSLKDLRVRGYIMEASLIEPKAPYYGDPEVYQIKLQPDDWSVLYEVEHLDEDYKDQVKAHYHLRNPDGVITTTHNYKPVEDGTLLVFQTKFPPKIDDQFGISRDEEWRGTRVEVVGSIVEQPDNLLLTAQFVDKPAEELDDWMLELDEKADTDF